MYNKLKQAPCNMYSCKDYFVCSKNTSVIKLFGNLRFGHLHNIHYKIPSM